MANHKHPHAPWQRITIRDNGKEYDYIVYPDAQKLTHRDRSGADYYYLVGNDELAHVCIPRFINGEIQKYDFSKPDEIAGIGCGICNEWYGYSYYYIGKDGKYTRQPNTEDGTWLESSKKVVQCIHARALIAYLADYQDFLLKGLIKPSKEYIAGWKHEFKIVSKEEKSEHCDGTGKIDVDVEEIA